MLLGGGGLLPTVETHPTCGMCSVTELPGHFVSIIQHTSDMNRIILFRFIVPQCFLFYKMSLGSLAGETVDKRDDPGGSDMFRLKGFPNVLQGNLMAELPLHILTQPIYAGIWQYVSQSSSRCQR